MIEVWLQEPRPEIAPEVYTCAIVKGKAAAV
jgi:hypothetical protein